MLSFGQPALVVDASVAVRFAQADPAWLQRWSEWIEAGTMVLTPAHFGHEIANALLLGAGLDADAAAGILDRLFAVGFETADRGLAGLHGSIRLADVHGLTVYDAAYLDLALDVDGQLATLDRALARAATAEGVEVVS
jgi:predicted nucleic acid-binding protein